MIGEKIRKIRTLKGYSQDYISEKLKMLQPAYSDIENSKTKVGVAVLEKIASILEIETNDILNFDENQVFNNTFNESSKGFFNIKKVVSESFEFERKSYKDKIKSQKE